MTSWALWGTVVNAAAVLLGALLGMAIRTLAVRFKRSACADTEQPSRFAALPDTVQKGLGLCVLLIGLQGALKAQNILVTILSVVLGVVTGELLDLDGLINRFGTWIEARMKCKGGNVAEGFVSATLLFCVGAMTVTGAMESGLMRVHTTYYAKAMLDMVSAVIFASSLGVGVLFSAAAVFAVQGVLTMIAVLAAGALPAMIVGEMMAVGSLLVVAIGTNLLGVTRIKVMNFVPAMFYVIGILPLYELLF